jgi:hypothetical protein
MSSQTKLNIMTTPESSAAPHHQVLTVPTKGLPATETKKKVIDTAHLNEEDLNALKKSDPFLYYSIPGVRAATIQSNRSVDTMSSLHGGVIPRRASCPSRIESAPTKVERRSSISFECHPDLLLENLEDDDELDVDFDEMFDKMLRVQKQ